MSRYEFPNCTIDEFWGAFQLVRARSGGGRWTSPNGIQAQIYPSSKVFWIIADIVSLEKFYVQPIEIRGNVFVPFNGLYDGYQPPNCVGEFMQAVKDELEKYAKKKRGEYGPKVGTAEKVKRFHSLRKQGEQQTKALEIISNEFGSSLDIRVYQQHCKTCTGEEPYLAKE